MLCWGSIALVAEDRHIIWQLILLVTVIVVLDGLSGRRTGGLMKAIAAFNCMTSNRQEQVR